MFWSNLNVIFALFNNIEEEEEGGEEGCKMSRFYHAEWGLPLLSHCVNGFVIGRSLSCTVAFFCYFNMCS